MRKINLLWITLVLVLAGCGQPGDLPIILKTPNTAKQLIFENQYGVTQIRPIEMVCYIDTSRYNPLNALDYTLRSSGVQFFDYVILGGGFIQSDAVGYHLEMTDDLRNLLTQRNRFVVPLQKKGIKVLIEIQSRGDDTFGHLNRDTSMLLAKSIYQHLEIYGLDGAEFNDSETDESLLLDMEKYENGELSESEQGILLEKWEKGANNFNDFMYLLRERYPSETKGIDIRKVFLFVKERNYGRFLPRRVELSVEITPDFLGSASVINYSFNPYPEQFYSDSRLKFSYTIDDLNEDTDSGSSPWMSEIQYGPLMVDLEGSPENSVLYPYGSTTGFYRYYSVFRDSSYRVVYYNNLQSVDQAKANPYFDNPDFDDTLPEPSEPLNDQGNMSPNARSVSQLVLFNRMIRTLFPGEQVVCTGGNHQKDW